MQPGQGGAEKSETLTTASGTLQQGILSSVQGSDDLYEHVQYEYKKRITFFFYCVLSLVCHDTTILLDKTQYMYSLHIVLSKYNCD